jgi:choline dehydrogenase
VGRVSPATARGLGQSSLALGPLEVAADRFRLRDGLRLAWRIANDPHVRRHVGSVLAPHESTVVSDEALDAYITRTVVGARVAAGTTRIGRRTDPMAVVDHRCRVHGVHGLVVADASVMPTIVRGDPTLMTVAIAERVARWQLDALDQGRPSP